MGEGSTYVLALPWHLYEPYPWTQQRVVASPAGQYFERPVLASPDPEKPGVTSPLADPRAAYLEYLFRHGGSLSRFGNLVAPLGVRYVLLSKVNDWEDYTWLSRQRDLRLVREWSDGALYENVHAVSLAYEVARVVAVRDWQQVIDLADDVDLTRTAVVTDRSATTTGHADRSRALALHKDDPATYRFARARSPTDPPILFAKPFDTRWRLNEAKPISAVGGVNLFHRRGADESIDYERWTLVRAGYALQIVVIALWICAAGWLRRRSHRTACRPDE